MSYTVLVPARMASTRLPGKPLADIHGVAMVVRVARRASRSSAAAVVVAADDVRIVERCTADGVRVLLTRADHATGSDRLAEACDLLGLADEDCIVNVQGDEPLIDPETIDACAALLRDRPDVAMSTAAHAITRFADYVSVDVVKVVLDRQGDALLFSRAPIPHRRATAGAIASTSARALASASAGISAGDDAADAALPDPAPLRHIGIYGYRVGALRRFARLPMAPIERTESLEQLRALWNGDRIAVHVASTSAAPGVDTPADLERMRLLCAVDDASSG